MIRHIAFAVFLISATGGLSAAEITNLGGGFGYIPTETGVCQVLMDTKYGQPILEIGKREPSKVIVVGAKGQCPGEYNGRKVRRITSGHVDGYIFSGVYDSGQRVSVYRKFGSSFTLLSSPLPKK